MAGGGRGEKKVRKTYRNESDRFISAYLWYHHGRSVEILNELVSLLIFCPIRCRPSVQTRRTATFARRENPPTFFLKRKNSHAPQHISDSKFSVSGNFLKRKTWVCAEMSVSPVVAGTEGPAPLEIVFFFCFTAVAHDKGAFGDNIVDKLYQNPD